MSARVWLVVVSCLVSVVTGLVLSRSPGGALPQARAKPLIGLSLDTLKEERWQSDRDLFVKRAGELGAEVLVQAANSDDTRQMQDIEALISRKVDALVIVPHNGAAMVKAVNLAHEAGIPVLDYDRMIPDSDVDLYVSFDAVRIGRMQAQYLVDRFAGRWPKKIVRIYGAKTDANSHLMKQGQDEILAPLIKDRKIVVVHEDWTEDWKPENAKKIMQAALTNAGQGIDAVLAANDGTAGGAIQALTEEGLAGKVIVTGQDAELAACQRIVRGTQAMTIYKRLKILSGAAAEAAYKLATRKPIVAKDEVDNGREKVPAILIDSVVATKDNMLSTVAADGFHSREEIYGQ